MYKRQLSYLFSCTLGIVMTCYLGQFRFKLIGIIFSITLRKCCIEGEKMVEEAGFDFRGYGEL